MAECAVHVLWASLVVQIALMVLAPVVLGRVLVRRGFGGWRLFFLGAATFVASQVVHIPLVLAATSAAAQPWFPHVPEPWKLPVDAVALGLAAGVCEEPARWIALRRFARHARGWKAAVLFGAGHGGVEAFLLGVLAAVNAVVMAVLRAAGPARLGLTGHKLTVANDTLATYWSMPPWIPLLGVWERVMAFMVHLAATTLVMRGVMTGRVAWLWVAIVFHTAVDAVAVYGLKRWGAVPVEALMIPFALLATGIVVIERRRESKSRTSRNAIDAM